MNIDLMPLAIVGAVLLLVIIALAVWRKVVATHEDDTIHVLEDAATVQNQAAVATRLAVIDRWGKVLTAVAVVYGLGVAVLYVYQVWVRSGSSTGM